MKLENVFQTVLMSVGSCVALLMVTINVAHSEQKQRVVSVAGPLTEIMYALNLEDKLVGVDTTSQWPEEALNLAKVGYQRALSAEGILGLYPDIVLKTADAGPPEVIQQLQDSGIDIESFPRDYSLEGVYQRIEGIGRVFGKPDRSEELIARIQSEVAEVRADIAGHSSPGVAFLLGTEVGSSMAAGSQTSAHAMINLSGGHNALESYDGYKPVNAEALIEAAPEFLIVASHGDGNDTDDIVNATLALPGVGLTPAGKHRRVIVMDAFLFLGFGPRTAEAMKLLAHELFKPGMPQ